jgi:hypothetical protein
MHEGPTALLSRSDLHADPVEIDRSVLDLGTHLAFRANGFARLHDLWDPGVSAALADEARAGRARAVLPAAGPRTPLDDPAPRPAKQTPVATGELLTRLHFTLVPVVRALSGRMLVPTFAAYGYYDEDDHVLLHVDTDQCEVTILIAALGEVGPLLLHPELRGTSMQDLGALECDPGWERASGTPLTYPCHGVAVLAGSAIPHHRPPRRLDTVSAVGALCYRSGL